MKRKTFILILSLMGMSLKSCSPTFMTNLLTMDTGRNNIKQSSSSQVKSKSKTKSKDERENRSISKTSGNVVLTCLGEGSSLSDATANALRSGIEQTYGAFVSSNTTILNDRIVKDEIVSVSSGNIVAYEIKSKNCINNKWNVVIQAEISQSKLASFAQSKGASVDINTSALAMNIKMARFNKESERKALLHLEEKFKELAPSCIDYILYITEPIHDSYLDIWHVYTWLGYKMNTNYQVLLDMQKETLKSLSMTADEVKKNESIGERGITREIDGEDYYLRDGSFSPWTDPTDFFPRRPKPSHEYFNTIAKNNFVLYRNGIDITTNIPEQNCYGIQEKPINCSDGFKTIVYDVMINTYENRTMKAWQITRGGGYDGQSIKIEKGEMWFGLYEVVLKLKDLERFNANYKIISKVNN